MNQISLFCLMMLCSATLSISFAQNSPTPLPAKSSSDAAIVMDQYFLALANGDSASIETLLGGQLLKKRKMLLANPVYSDHLKNIYQNAEFTVLDYQFNTPGSVAVEVLIALGEGETIRKRYLLQKPRSKNQQSTFVIVSETAIADPR